LDSLSSLISALILSAVSLFIPPLLDSVERKVRAKVQSRIGPPTLLQTWYDISKLLRKELKMPRGSELSAVLIILALVAIVVAVFLPFISIAFHAATPLISFIIITSAVHMLLFYASTATSNPFAVVGTSRAVALIIINEVALISYALFLISQWRCIYVKPAPVLMALVGLLISCYVASGRIPFDIYEAEPELASGSMIEFSGPLLGLYIYVHTSERYFYSLLPAAISALIIFGEGSIHSAMTAFAVAVLLYIVYGIIAAILGRTRVDIGVKTLTFLYLLMYVGVGILCIV